MIQIFVALLINLDNRQEFVYSSYLVHGMK